MTRETSIEAYYAIRDSGLLSRRRFEIYEILALHGPLTANQAFQHLERNRAGKFRFDSNTRARLTELREFGVITEIGTQKCSVSGMNTILWEITGRLPVKPAKKPTKTMLIKELRIENERLRTIISGLYAKLNLLGGDLQ